MGVGLGVTFCSEGVWGLYIALKLEMREGVENRAERSFKPVFKTPSYIYWGVARSRATSGR